MDIGKLKLIEDNGWILRWDSQDLHCIRCGIELELPIMFCKDRGIICSVCDYETSCVMSKADKRDGHIHYNVINVEIGK